MATQERKDTHFLLDKDIYDTLNLLKFVSKRTRDDIVNEILIRVLPSEIETLLSNQSSENPFTEWQSKLEKLISHFENKATELNRKENP